MDLLSSGLARETIVFALYVVICIVLVLGGSLIGKILYQLYVKLDPTAYDSSAPQVCSTKSDGQYGCVDMTAAEKEVWKASTVADDGRWVGKVFGGLIGIILVFLKGYDMYSKLKQ